MKYFSVDSEQSKEVQKKYFDHPDSDIFILEGMDFLSIDGLNLLWFLQEDLMDTVPYIKTVHSILDILPASISFPLDPKTEDAIHLQKWLSKRIHSSQHLRNTLLGEQQSQTIITIQFRHLTSELAKTHAAVENSSNSPYIAIGRALEKSKNKFLSKPSAENLSIWISGTAYIVYKQYIFYLSDLKKIFSILITVILILTFLMLRSSLAFIGTILGFFIVNWLVIGTLAAFKIYIDLTFIMIPITIGVATTLGYALHFFNYLKQSLHRNIALNTAITISWLRSIRPITFTALTTMLSFLSLYLVPIPAIQAIGYACILEVFFIYLYIMIVFPLILSYGKFQKKPHTLKLDFGHKIKVLSHLSSKKAKGIILFTCTLLIIALYYIPSLENNYQFSEFVGEHNDFIQEIRKVQESELGSFGTINLIIHSPSEELIPKPKASRALSKEEKYTAIQKIKDISSILEKIEAEKIVKNIFWIGEIIEDATRFKETHKGIASLSSIEELNSLLLLVDNLSQFGLKSRLSQDRKSLQVNIQLNAFESKAILELRDQYHHALSILLPNANIYFTGFMLDISTSDRIMTQNFIYSILVSLLIVFILLLLLFRNFFFTLISMLPNILPIILIAGMMGYLDFKLNSFNLLMFPMIIGLIIDDTIHLFYTVMIRFHCTPNYSFAIQKSLRHVAPALIKTTIILALTFSVFLFSNFQALANMGLFTILMIILALIGDLLLGPILLSLTPVKYLKQWDFPKKNQSPIQASDKSMVYRKHYKV